MVLTSKDGDAKIDDKHNEIAALMKEWEEKMAMME